MKKYYHPHLAVCMLLLIFAAFNKSSAQTDGNIRPPFTLKLFVDSTAFYNSEMGATKYIPKDGVIQVFPAETLYVEADLAKDSLVNLKAVPSLQHPEKTLVISFEQAHNGRQHERMLLSVKNPFNKVLNYSAIVNLMKQQRWVQTSVIPVRPNALSKELWPDVITTIVLSGFKLEDK